MTRKPLLALGAGLCMPGLGHLYLGDPVRAASYLLGVSLLVPAAARLALWAPHAWLCFIALGGVIGAVALYIRSACEAFRLARRAGDAPLASWQRPSVYALYVVSGYVFVLAPLTTLARERYLETFVVPSGSMAPAILAGDRVFADKTVGKPGGAKLERGSIAIFVYPNDRTLLFVKRVAGLPGDRLELDGQSVIVPSGQIFLLGDDRANALDSRRFGSVPLSDVKGVARQVWFSSHAGAGIRWSRIGHVLR